MPFRKTILLVLILCGGFSYSQNIRLDKEALAGLTSEDTINVIFAYNEITFDATYKTEEVYLQELRDKISRRKNAEVALNWENNFITAKQTTFPEAFVHNLNASLAKYDNAPTFALSAKNTNYTMVLHTHWMNFGWDIGAVKQPSKARMTLYFYKTSDPVNFISKTEIRNAEGLVSDSRYGNGLGPLPSLASMRNVYERLAPKVAKGLRRIVK